ncbi:MAG: histidine triad nucleotide-binding protein [Elusimicrobia bacterium]|nr:histidine triad nucleotide-binding protein [Elusimicrobiota bacterium]
MPDCLFCKIAAREIPATLVFEDEQVVAFKDINPKAPTHVLVVPKKHLDRLSSSEDEDSPLLGHLQRVAVYVAGQLSLKDFRLVVNNGRGAGQTVDHLHYHLMGGRPMQWPPG